jgi:V/A-type H+-transporting ATPase subunit I
MAIEKMKKLRLMAVRSQKEALMRDMMLLGCVQITEPGQDEMSDPDISAVVKREGSELTRYKSQYASLCHAVELLDKYAPAKTSFLSPKPEVECGRFLETGSLDATLQLAAGIEDAEERIKRIAAEESRQRGVIESLLPWQELDLPLEYSGSKLTSTAMGMMPAAADFASAQAAVAAVTEEAELFLVSADKDQQYVLLVCFKTDQPAVLEALRAYSFALSAISGLTGTAKENTAICEKNLADLAKERDDLISDIAGKAGSREELKLCADRIETMIASAEAEDRLYGLDSAIVLEGWMLAEKEPELEALFDKYDCAWESEEPTEEDFPDVPVKLRNNRFTRPLNMVTEMYSLPAYNGVDPNPLIAPFFILIYGLMMADMAYGMIMFIAGLLVLKKKRPTGGTRNFFELLTFCGVTTFFGGLVTGGFFGNAIPTVAEAFFNTPESQLPAWLQAFDKGLLFNPLENTVAVLLGSMALGLIQLNTGLAVNFAKEWRRGQKLDAILGEGAQWVILIGIILTVLKVAAGKIVLIIGAVTLLYGATKDSKGFGKVGSAFGCIYNTVTGWFGDLLSYSRIMALMLAGSVIAQVFNTLGAIPKNIFVFILIFLFGHVLNFALNLLGCYVHDLRLQCLEYFGKFYEDGGKPFKPLGIYTKYYDVVKN